MKTAKVLKVEIQSWKGQYGEMFTHKMELDNGETIKLNKKKDNSFKVGDTVNYEENGDGKWKEVKEERTYQPRAVNNDNNVGAMIGMAMKLAFEHLYDKTNYEETYELGVRIFEDSMALLENYGKMKDKPESKVEDNNEEMDLPF